jgi:putative transposase
LAYKFRLAPNGTQAKALASQLETLRQVYNAALAYWRDLYAEETRAPKANELYKVFSTLRNLQIRDQRDGGAGPHWLAHVSAVSVRDTCLRVKKAFDNFFRRVKQKAGKVGYPRFKGYGRLTSISFENYASGCTLRDEKGRTLKANVPLARKGYRLDLFGVGRVKALAHRAVVGKIKTACVERDVDGKWYVVLVSQTPDVTPAPAVGPAVGIDVGLEHFLTTSAGEHVANPKLLAGNLKTLRRLQRASSRKMETAKRRKVKFRACKNLQKSFHEVAKLHVRVRNLRKEHHHQVANRLVREYGTVCVEKLNVRGMVRNNKLARSISDAGWSAFLTVLKHKATKAGVRFVEVDPCGTSQTCPECGAVRRKKLSERVHRCPCGCVIQRDHAAARIILARGVGANPAGSVGAVRVNDPKPVGMPCERSRGGRAGQRNPDAIVTSPPKARANRSRKKSQTPPIPGME